MKICVVSNSFSHNSIGGLNIYVNNVISWLVEKGHQVSVITINHGKNDSDSTQVNDLVKIYKFYPFNVGTFCDIGTKPFIRQAVWTLLDIYNYYSYLKIRDILLREKPDVVHIQTPLDMTLAVFDAAKGLRLPTVFTVHDYLLLCRRVVLSHNFIYNCVEKNVNPLCRLLYRNFSRMITNKGIDIVIAPSQFVLDTHIKYGFFKKSKNIILPHGIEMSTEENNENISQKEKFEILYIGSLREHKGVNILIEAVKQISNKNIRLTIIGDGLYRDQLVKLAGNDDRIIFIGKVDNKNLGSFYNNADIVVVPSLWYEVFGIVIQESFRAARPVVASKIGGIPELVKDSYNGFLFDPGNIAQLRQILETIIDKPAMLGPLRKNAYETAKQFEITKYIGKLIEIYKEAAEINRRHL